jgi:hypothetical protein
MQTLFSRNVVTYTQLILSVTRLNIINFVRDTDSVLSGTGVEFYIIIYSIFSLQIVNSA